MGKFILIVLLLLSVACERLIEEPGFEEEREDITEEEAVPSQVETLCHDDLSSKIGQRVLWSVDFEALDENGWVAGWSEPRQQTPGKAVPSFTLDSNIKHNGKRSLKITAATTESHSSITLRTGAIRVIPETEYVLSYWVKGTDVVSKTGHLAILQKTTKETASGGLSQDNSVYWFTPYPKKPPTYEWQQVINKFTIPANQDAMSATILFQNGSGTVWLDDIVVMPADQVNLQPKTTLAVETRTSEPGAPARHYFLRDKPIQAKAILENQQDQPAEYLVKATLSFCNKKVDAVQYTVQVSANDSFEFKLMDIDPSGLALGDYLLHVSIENEGQVIDSVEHPIGLRLDPKPAFVFSMATPLSLDLSTTHERLDQLKSHHLIPQLGEALDQVFDAVLGKGMPFITRLMPNVLQFPKRIGVKGEDYPGIYAHGLSDPAAWSQAANEIGSAVQRISHFPAFFPRIFTSDDFSIVGGLDWSQQNKDRFKQLTGLEAPVPKELTGKTPPYTIGSFAYPKGSVSANEPWLSFNRFVSGDVLGGYNKTLADAVTQANPAARIGPISGGMQWPLFLPGTGQYPPHNFGGTGFNMISYYMYLNYWRPQLAYLYWTEIGRMANRDLPEYAMPDSMHPEKSYLQNTFYLLLAGGVDGMSYFVYSASSPEFWEVARDEIGPIAKRFGPLLVKLKPEKRPVGLLVSHTTANYWHQHPLHALCAFANLMMAHVDVEPVAEEEILAGRPYEAIVLSDVDWLRSDMINKLSLGSTPVVVDKATEVSLKGDHVKNINLNLVEGNCAGKDPDYGKPNRLNKIRTAINDLVSPDVQVDSDTVIYRKFSAGNATYLWLVNVHSTDEYKYLFDWMTYNGGYQDKAALEQAKAYLASQGVYDGTVQAQVSLRDANNVAVVDVIDGKPLSATSVDGWTDFTVEIPRLGGKLIALYPAEPTAVDVEVPNVVTAGQPTLLHATILKGNSPINAVFPIKVELRGPAGDRHPYSRFTATNSQGAYELPVVIGSNAPKGKWLLEVTELSTHTKDSATFVVN